MGQGRGLKEQAFQGEGTGGEAWWVAGEDEGMWVWVGKETTSLQEAQYTSKPRLLEPWLVVLCGQQHRVNLGHQGDYVDTGQQSQLSGCFSNICAVHVVCKVGLQARLEPQAELLPWWRCPL